MPETINLTNYKKLISDGGGFIMFVFICIVFGVVVISKSGLRKLENNWINTEHRIFNYTIYNDTHNDSYKNSMQNRHQMIYLFPIISVTVAILSFLRSVIFYLFARKASISLHGLLFERIVNDSMGFFSTHYIGNILNRFSEDLLYVDERVPYSMYLVLGGFAEIIGIMILMGSVNLTFLTICLVFSTFPIVTIIFFLRVGKILKQLELSSDEY
ncbi:unnamed protein product [Tenebrio molitor]|nr:unnamed protein product [Tenebrio molitor]